ncbi:hypothetical protein ANAEL_00780 [Anaerolineales bacterium]|nr:hypothetical protein ANAEL_00780 [Anaerolineales bacterium]
MSMLFKLSCYFIKNINATKSYSPNIYAITTNTSVLSSHLHPPQVRCCEEGVLPDEAILLTVLEIASPPTNSGSQ